MFPFVYGISVAVMVCNFACRSHSWVSSSARRCRRGICLSRVLLATLFRCLGAIVPHIVMHEASQRAKAECGIARPAVAFPSLRSSAHFALRCGRHLLISTCSMIVRTQCVCVCVAVPHRRRGRRPLQFCRPTHEHLLGAGRAPRIAWRCVIADCCLCGVGARTTSAGHQARTTTPTRHSPHGVFREVLL